MDISEGPAALVDSVAFCSWIWLGPPQLPSPISHLPSPILQVRRSLLQAGVVRLSVYERGGGEGGRSS